MSTSPYMDERIERMNQAAQHGNIDAFYIIIQKDVKLLKHIDKLPFVNSPLHIAAYAGHIPFAMELMRLKPSFSRKLNPDGFSPIHLALQNGHGELVCRLLEIDGELFRVKGREGITPLHYVAATECHLDRLEKFLEFCPHSIEAVTIRNENALHIALKYDKLEAFRLLVRWLQKNWSQNSILWESKVLNWQDENGNTPLHIAVYKNQPKAVRRLLLYSGVNIFAKNSEGKTAGDILAQQNQIENREIKLMLQRVGALRAPSLPKVTFYARHLWSMFSSLEKTRMHCIGEWTQISDDRRNMLLVVATLLMTVTYQGVLSPPGGLWQDDYLPEPNTTLPAIRKFNSSAPIPNEAGTPIDLRNFPFWVFLSLNSLTFMLSYSTILLLIPKQRIYQIVRLSLLSLSVCYIVSLTVIIPTRFWEMFWYVSIAMFLCIFLLNTSATCVAWSYKACL
ncbi:ankyrin repeat-containing protein BDA1-like [Castanea sativa]|uniref:ankyrin repeat-containing protein BDA1-like n=1 Tax=Castanea sativa TaxID=21020 RepID=UPI003F652B97